MAQPPPQPPPRKYKRNRRHRIKLLNKKSIWDAPALHNFLLSQNTKILHARCIYKYLMRTPNASIQNLDNKNKNTHLDLSHKSRERILST